MALSVALAYGRTHYAHGISYILLPSNQKAELGIAKVHKFRFHEVKF